MAEYSRASNSYVPAEPWWIDDPDDLPVPAPISLARWQPTPLIPKHNYNVPLDTATAGYCPEEGCENHFDLMMAGLVVVAFVAGATRIPSFFVSIRAIDVKDKATCIILSTSGNI